VKPNELTATQALARLHAGELTVEALAAAHLERIAERDEAVRGWAYLDPAAVMEKARSLDAAPVKGPLHGVTVAVKDVILTEDMPTQHNSPLYKDSFPRLDAGCVKTLRAAGALILGKADTTEFASVTRRGTSRHPLDPTRTPGGSSSGSAAVVADFQAMIGLGTQTAGSTIRPGSFCGIYAMKPTWGAINREGLKMLALSLDTLGLYARSVEDLELLADVFALEDRAPPPPFALEGARIAAYRSPAWGKMEPAGRAAFERGVTLLQGAGAKVERLELPASFDALPEHQARVMAGEAATTFLSELRAQGPLMHEDLIALATNKRGVTRAALLASLDAAAAARVAFDEIAAGYDAVLTPSAPGEAPQGPTTGDASLNAMWTLLHVPVVQVPGFRGPNGMPIGLSLVGPRYTDRRVLRAAQVIGTLFAAQGAG
jgi:Asp-tRNA(Asn)/Glu-tRNA(Gln) amidotransferase A subunit family amidase